MSFQIIGEFVVNGTKKAEKEFKNVTSSVGKLNKELKGNREAFNLVDDATGGFIGKAQNFQKGFTGGISAVKNLTKGMSLLKGAMISTGIGALVVALALIADNWEKILGFITGANNEASKNVELTTEIADAQQDQLDALNGSTNILKLQGKSERDILVLKQKQTEETIKALEAQLLAQQELKKQQVETAERNQNILSGILKFVAAPLTLILKTFDMITGKDTMSLFDDLASNLFDPEQVEEDADKTIEATQKKLDQLKNQHAGFVLSIQNIDETARQKKIEEENKEIQDAKDKAEKERQEKLARDEQNYLDKQNALQQIEDLENQYFESLMSKQQQEELAVQEKYFNLIEQAKKYGQDTTILEEARQKELSAIDKNYGDKKKAREQALASQQMRLAGQTFGQLTEILGKNSVAGKSAAVAQATINTYQGVTEVWKTPSVLPEPFATIQRIVSTATVLASGLKTVQQIKSVPKPQGVKGGSGSGGGTVSTATATPPQIDFGGGGTFNQISDALSNQDTPVVQAFVVANDVTTAQSLQNNIQQSASLG